MKACPRVNLPSAAGDLGENLSFLSGHRNKCGPAAPSEDHRNLLLSDENSSLKCIHNFDDHHGLELTSMGRGGSIRVVYHKDSGFLPDKGTKGELGRGATKERVSIPDISSDRARELLSKVIALFKALELRVYPAMNSQSRERHFCQSAYLLSG